MGTKLECMDVLYIISEFQFQEGGGGISSEPSPIISHKAVLIPWKLC